MASTGPSSGMGGTYQGTSGGTSYQGGGMGTTSTLGSGPGLGGPYQGTSGTMGTETIGKKVNLMILGATGTTGRAVVEEIGEKYHQKFRIYAGIHESAPGDSKFLDNIDIFRRIDADNLASLDFTNIDYLFIIPSNAENRVEQVRHYVDAAKRSGVKYILLLSSVNPPNRDTLFARQFSQIENFVSDAGIPCTFLRTTFFQQNFFAHAEEISTQNTISLPIRQGKCAPIHVRDVARASAAILKNPENHMGKAYNLVGPEVLDGSQIAEAACRALGRPIRFVDIEPESFLQAYERQGIPKWLAKGFSEVLQLVASNELATYDTKNFYEELTGSRGITVEDFFRENRAYFTESRGGFGGGVSSMGVGSGSGMGAEGSGTSMRGDELNTLSELIREVVSTHEAMIRTKRETLRLAEDRLQRILQLHSQFDSKVRSGGRGIGYGEGYRGLGRGGEEGFGMYGREGGRGFGRGGEEVYGREGGRGFGRDAERYGRGGEYGGGGDRYWREGYGREPGFDRGRERLEGRYGRDDYDRYGRERGGYRY